MTAAHIIAARRSAVVPRGGAFAGLSIEALGAPVIAALLQDAGLEPGHVDEVILSNALGAGGNPARRVALLAGLPQRVAGVSIDRQCAGGLDALVLAQAMVLSGQAEAVIAGGVESYSQRPIRQMPGAAAPYDEAPFTPWPDRDPGMAEAAAALAGRLGLTRVAMDAWAVDSHRKACAAAEELQAEIVALAGVARDAFTRRLTPHLAARAPGVTGPITAANAAVAADGAALVLVVSDRIAAKAGRALRIAGGATRGGLPWEPGLAPVAAIAQVLTRAGLAPDALAQSEVMEAYAVQAIACVRGAGLDPARVNLRGGALARGHPVGASGAILAVRLFHDLTRAGHPGPGLAAIAAAGGIGTALLLA
ncbi:MAG: hypothetical protein RIT14_2936 [Pseudomonadota bacterium]